MFQNSWALGQLTCSQREASVYASFGQAIMLGSLGPLTNIRRREPPKSIPFCYRDRQSTSPEKLASWKPSPTPMRTNDVVRRSGESGWSGYAGLPGPSPSCDTGLWDHLSSRPIRHGENSLCVPSRRPSSLALSSFARGLTHDGARGEVYYLSVPCRWNDAPEACGRPAPAPLRLKTMELDTAPWHWSITSQCSCSACRIR